MMKKNNAMLWAWGLGAALVGVGLGGIVVAQGPGQPGAATGGAAPASAAVGRTRIAFMNLQEVIKAYPKYISLQDAVKQKDKMYMDRLKAMDDQLKEMQKKYQTKETPQQERDQIEANARRIKADMENLTNEAKKDLIKFHDDSMSQIYLEIDTVVREHAAANGIDIVFRFTEDWNKDTYFKPENVVRRMTLPIWPMYYDQNLNITAVVSRTVNAKFAQAAQPPAGNVVPAAGTNANPK